MNALKIENIISEIGRITNFHVSWLIEPIRNGNGIIDGKLRLDYNNTQRLFWGELKNSVIPASIPTLINQIQNIHTNDLSFPMIVIAQYISQEARNRLKENNINYIDSAGNIFLNDEPIYIYQETGKSGRAEISNHAGRAFTKTGLKVVFQLLKQQVDLSGIDPECKLARVNLNSSYDDLASAAEVSKDTVAKVMKDLLSQKYILKASKNEFKWNSKKALFDQWVEAFNHTLKPKLTQRNYRLRVDDFTFNEPVPGYQFSGIEGTRRLNIIPPNLEILNPNITIYTHKEFKSIMNDYPVIPDEEGKISFIEAFWKEEATKSFITNVALIYADLIKENDPRYSEIAALLRKTFIHE